MNKKYILICFIPVLVILGYCSCSSIREQKELENIDARKFESLKLENDIHVTRKLLVDSGINVSEIADMFGDGKTLYMVISLESPDLLDSFGYITGIDLKLFESKKASQIYVEADNTGIIQKIEPK